MRRVHISFFFKDPATTEIYTLSLHDALPISAVAAERHGRARDPRARHGEAVALGRRVDLRPGRPRRDGDRAGGGIDGERGDRKSTRLNSSHANISYAVFCLKKKKIQLSHRHI